MLTINELVKSYGGLVAVDHISFEVREGEIFGVLGPNGAGKSTTINMIASLLKPDGGSILLDGTDIASLGERYRRVLGLVPQEVAIYEELSARENLSFWASLYGLRGAQRRNRLDEVLDLSGLKERQEEPVKSFSGGMKRRLNMAIGLVHKPRLLLLDEPTVGIDPQGRHRMLDTVRHVASEKTSIIYTTHYLDEAEALCDRLVIIDHGRRLAMGSQEEIKGIVGENRLLRIVGGFERDAAESLPREMPELSLVALGEDEATYALPMSVGTGQFLEKLVNRGFKIDNLSIKEPSLDSVFIKLTGRELRD